MSKISVTGPAMPDKKGIFDAAEEEVTRFDQWFRSQGNEPLVNAERAILKTYLVARLAGLVPSDPLPAETSKLDSIFPGL